MKRPFVVTGSVRSGTTLISRCLAAHSQVVCPSDPAFGFFRSFRNALREHSGVPVVDPDEPLTDFFPVPADYLSSLMSCDLRIPLFKGSPSLLQSEIAKFAAAPTNAPSILPRISEIDADSYADAFQQLLGVFEGALGSKKTECSGFKQTWIEAFVPALFRTFELKGIHIIRDIRGVVASWKATRSLRNNYPFLMILRHWRKSVAFAKLCQKVYQNYIIIRYEDFVARPEESATRLFESLGIPFEPDTIDTKFFRSGQGGTWSANTSYESIGTDEGLVESLANRWKERLNTREIRYIEEICGPEMMWAGYERITEPCVEEDLTSPPPFERLQVKDEGWISTYVEAYQFDSKNIELERERWRVAMGYEGDTRAESMFVDPSLLVTHN